MGVEVLDGDGQKVVGVHQAAIRGDDAVPVGVGVVSGEDVEVVFVGEHGCHGRRRRRIHPDLAVPVERHEREVGVDNGVHDGEVELVTVGDRPPVAHACAAEGVCPDADAGPLDGIHIDDVVEVVNVVAAEVVLVDGARLGHQHFVVAVRDQIVRPIRDPAGRIRVGRAAVGRVVLETAIAGRVVARRDHDAVSQPGPGCFRPAADHGRARPVVAEDGVAERRCRHEIAELVDAHVDAVAD